MSVEEVYECRTYLAIKSRMREPERDGTILSDNGQDGNVALGGIGILVR